MKKLASLPVEVSKKPERQPARKELTKEPVTRARQAVQKADALLGTAAPRTAAEHHLVAQRAKLVTWLKRFGLMGAIAAGNAGLFAAAEHAGDALHEGAVAVGSAIRSLGDIQPIHVEFGGSEDVVLDQNNAPQMAPGYVSWPEQNTSEITIADSGDPFAEPDATLQEDSYAAREQRHAELVNESAGIIADEFEADGFFSHDLTPSGFLSTIEAKMRAMGFTEARDFESARLFISQRFRQDVRDRAGENIEEAMRMADRVNTSIGGIDTYALALDHHRPDLAAATASRSVTNLGESLRDMREEYADDPDRQAEEARRLRREMLQNGLLSSDHAQDAPDVFRHLGRNDRSELASAIDAELAALQEQLSDPGAPNFALERMHREIERLQAARRSL